MSILLFEPDGQFPPALPRYELTIRRSEAEKVTEDEQKAALERKEVFAKWFLHCILAVQTLQLFDTIVVTPLSDAKPEYRDNYQRYASHRLDFCLLSTPMTVGRG